MSIRDTLHREYPRDLVGYGARPVDPKWPGGARLALQIALNYECGGELCVLHGDDRSEGLLTDAGIVSVPSARNFLFGNGAPLCAYLGAPCSAHKAWVTPRVT